MTRVDARVGAHFCTCIFFSKLFKSTNFKQLHKCKYSFQAACPIYKHRVQLSVYIVTLRTGPTCVLCKPAPPPTVALWDLRLLSFPANARCAAASESTRHLSFIASNNTSSAVLNNARARAIANADHCSSFQHGHRLEICCANWFYAPRL